MEPFSSNGKKHRLRPSIASLVLVPAASAILATWLTPAAQASSFIFANANVRAQFDVDNTAQTVTIYLLNLQLNPKDITEALGSLRLNPDPSLAASKISTFDINANGVPLPDKVDNSWAAHPLGGTTIGLCAVCASGGSTELIIGGPDGNGRYSAGDSKIQTNGPKIPFIIGSGATYTSGKLAGLDTSPSWTLKFSGITNSQKAAISNVTFGFGLDSGKGYGTDFYTMANYTEYDVPEPESNIMVITGLGLVLLSVAVRRYRQSRF